MRAVPRVFPALLLALLAGPALLTGCAAGSGSDPAPERLVVSPPDPDAPRHTHETAIGDGTLPTAGGYTLRGLTFPRTVGRPGDLSFRIEDAQGEPVTDYVEEQTKLLHLYVVREDLAVFRHLHPTLSPDGTWTARLALDRPGRYRVVAELVPAARAGGSHVVLGRRATLPGEPGEPGAGGDEPESVGSDGLVTVAAPTMLATGTDERMVLTVSDGDRGVLNLGTYLGAYAHLTGFDVQTGAFVHAHPLGGPTITEDGSELEFHTSFSEPGRYRFFVQVRVDGFVHTVPVSATVR